MTIWSAEIKNLEKLYDSLKENHPKLARELEKLIKTDDENMVLVYARRCLEIIITDLCECELQRPRKTEPLQGIIDKLNKEEKVPSNIIASMHGLNMLSTFGAHPKDFEPEQVKPVLNNLDTIIKWYLNYKDFRIPFKEKQEAQADVFNLSKRKGSPFQKQSLRRILSPAFLGIILILALIYYIPKLIQKAGKQKSVATEMIRSIAVMPVLNFTGDPGLAWIADMIQNDLTGQLQGISNLIVRPRQTTLQFRDSEESVQSIAQKLSVNSLIEASVKGTEDNLQLEIRVVEAFPEEKYLYSSSFIQSFNALTSIYGEITNDILKRLKVNTTDEEEKVLSARTVNPAVRKACARGLYFMNQLTEEGVETGIRYYKEAIDIDPADPEPYIGLALGYSGAGHGAGLASLDLAKAYALKAIELDPDELHPNLADAHVVLAEVYLYHDYDFVKSEHHLKRAINLNPSSAPAHYTYGWYLALTNQVDEAADEMKKAIKIDPLNPICTGYLAWLYQWFGRYEEALNYAQDALKINPEYPMAFYVQGMVYSEMGRHEEAIEIQQKIYAPRSGFASGLGVAYAYAGQKDKALEIAAAMEEQNMKWHTWGLADIYSALGDEDKAIYWIEQAYEQKHDFIPWIKNNPYYKRFSGNPRFQDIIKSLNLPE